MEIERKKPTWVLIKKRKKSHDILMLIWSYTPHMLIYAHCPMPCEPRWAWERKPEAAPAWHISVPNSQLMQKWETPSVPIIYYIKCIKTKHQPAIDAMCIQRIWPQRRARARERREREKENNNKWLAKPNLCKLPRPNVKTIPQLQQH